jgi:opacity protein-like surface antigen
MNMFRHCGVVGEIFLSLIAGGPLALAQTSSPSAPFSVSVVFKGSYTTSARFLYNVDKPDQFLDSKYFSPIFGFGGSVRANFNGDFAIGISTEKIKFAESSIVQYIIGGDQVLVPVNEGFVLYPVELSGYFFLPFSTDNFRVYLGGGVGAYFGERSYSIGSENMNAENSPSGFGIHVLTGVEFALVPKVMLQSELKFRDPQFDSVNKFQHASTIVNGIVIPLSMSPETTRVNVNGITYTLGIAYTL